LSPEDRSGLREKIKQMRSGFEPPGSTVALAAFWRLSAAIVYHLPVMKTSNTHDQRIAKMSFASVYPMYLAKAKKKGRTRDELHQVIRWLTGFG
jgi:hypothetical protein